MSSAEMRVPPQEASMYPSRIELIACCAGAYIGAFDGQDMVSLCLQKLASMPFQRDVFFGPLHLASLKEPIGQGTEMSAFLFAWPVGVAMRRLCSCTAAARLVVSVMPITASERDYALQHGPGRLIELFEKRRVPNVFDLTRKGVV
jgi:hypothetical protein